MRTIVILLALVGGFGSASPRHAAAQDSKSVVAATLRAIKPKLEEFASRRAAPLYVISSELRANATADSILVRSALGERARITGRHSDTRSCAGIRLGEPCRVLDEGLVVSVGRPAETESGILVEVSVTWTIRKNRRTEWENGEVVYTVEFPVVGGQLQEPVVRVRSRSS